MTLQDGYDHVCQIHGTGPNNPKAMFIGIAPGKVEATKTFEVFTGPAGKFLTATLKALNIERESCFLTNLICWWEDSPTEREIDICWSRLQNEIQTVNPHIIILLGRIVSDRFLGKRGTKSLWKRGHLYWLNNRWYLPTYHPAAFLHADSKIDVADFVRDLQKIELAPEKPLDVDYVVAESAEEANAIVWSISGFNYIDVETSYDGLDFVYPKEGLVGTDDSKMLCFSITNERGTWVIPGKFIGSLKPGWASRDNVSWGMHLGMFDKAQFKRLVGENIYISEDSLLQSYSLDERGGQALENDRAVGIHGLKGLASEYFGADDYEVDVLKADANTLHKYNAHDTFYGYKLVELNKPRQIKDNVREMYETILIPGANVLSEIQSYGVKIDKAELYRQGAKWTERWLIHHEWLTAEAYKLGWKGEPINPGSWQQLQLFLFNICMLPPHPIFKKSTRKEVIEWLADKGFEWCRRLITWRGIDHILSNYIVGVENQLKYDGKIHPQPVMHGTRSGRLAYKNPAVNTIPHYGVDPELAEVRLMYVANDEHDDEEMVLLEADLKQAELWAVGYLSEDDVLLHELTYDDAHAITAEQAFNITRDHELFKSYRELGKLFNFGTLYNRTAEGYAKNPFQGRKPPKGLEDYKLTIGQAKRIMTKQMERWPKVREWQKSQTYEALHTGEQVTRNGRKRRYWYPTFKTVNQSVNLGPQTLGHDYLFDAMQKVHHEFNRVGFGHVLFEVHDALLTEVPKRRLDDCMEIVHKYMTEPKFGFGGIPCDMAVGPNWHDVKKV